MIPQIKPHDLKKWQNHYYFFLTLPNHVQRVIIFTDWIPNNLRTSFRLSRRIQFFHKAFPQRLWTRQHSKTQFSECIFHGLHSMAIFCSIFYESFPEWEMVCWCVCQQYSIPWIQFELEPQNTYLNLFLLKSVHMDRYRILEINLMAMLPLYPKK